MTQILRTQGIVAARDFQELPAWQKSVSLAETIFNLTADFADAGLAAQMRASAVTVATSIAAASGRNNEFGTTDSYSKAQSAAAELVTQGELARRLGFMTEDFSEALDEVSRLITGLKHGLKVAAKDAERAERDAAKAERDAKAERPARREYKPRSDAGDERPRREYKPRGDGEDRPRREYKPRNDAGDERPRREYKPRDDRGGDERPRREFKPRSEGAYGEKKSYGDKKPYGKKSFGDEKPYGDRKPGGGKPFRKPRD